MRLVYAPFIGRVVSLAQSRIDGDTHARLADAAREAVVSLQAIEGYLDQLDATILRSHDAVERALRDVRTCFGLVAAALASLETLGETPTVEAAKLADAVDTLEGAVSELWRALEVLGHLQAGEESGSPFPTINHTVKSGMNVLDGHLPVAALAAWLPFLEAVVAALEGRVARFGALHPDAPVAPRQAAESLTADLRAGTGALRLACESGDRATLVDGLRLLRHGSEALALVLEALDHHVRETATWSSVPAIEALCRALAADAPALVRDDCASSVATLIEGLEAQNAALNSLPLAFTVDAPLQAFSASLARVREAFANTCAPPTDPAAVAHLGRDIEAACAARDTALAQLEREMDGAARSPGLEALKEMAGRCLQGALSEKTFREHVISWLKAHAILEMRVREAARDALASDAAELLALLHQQGEGIEEATRFFRNGDPTHLADGLRKVEAPLAGIDAIRQRVLRSLGAGTSSTPAARCFACTTPNDPRRTHCARCGTRLPEIARAPQTPHADEAAEAPLPRNIARLQRIVEAYEQHRASPDAVQYEAALLLSRLGHVRRDFERRFVPRLRAEGSPALTQMARDFYETLVDLQGGLHELLAFGDHGRPDGLYRGLQTCIEAGRAMQGAQARIEEVLGCL